MSETQKSLPSFYDDNMIGFFPQGPDTIFVYWELFREQWESLAEMGGPFIRLHRVIENENAEYEYLLEKEIKPPPYTGNWYFDGLDPGTRYCFEVGGKLWGGSFLPLLKSDIMVTPPAPMFDVAPIPAVRGGGDHPAKIRGAKNQPEGFGKDLEMDDVLTRMPFYMGYRTLV